MSTQKLPEKEWKEAVSKILSDQNIPIDSDLTYGEIDLEDVGFKDSFFMVLFRRLREAGPCSIQLVDTGDNFVWRVKQGLEDRVRPSVVEFAALMEAKLAKHDEEFHVDDYKRTELLALAGMLRGHVHKAIMQETKASWADVANFALMCSFHCKE